MRLVRRLALLLAALGAAAYAATPAILRRAFRVNRVRATEHFPTDGVFIQGQRGKRLAARFLSIPDQSGVVLMMHGWNSSSADLFDAVQPLHRARLGVLLLDARCHGYSDDDDFASMPRFAEDIEAALEWLDETQGIPAAGVVLMGHSVGAGAALFVASRRRVAGVVAVSSMAHPREVMDAMVARIRLPRPLARYIRWRIQDLLSYRFDEFAPVNTARRASCPVLIVHGDHDETIPVSDAYRLHDAAGGRAEMILIEGADHRSKDLFLQRSDEIIRWATSALHAGSSSTPSPP